MALISLRSWEIWARGLISAVVGGGASSLLAALGIPAADAIGMTIKPLDWQQLKAVAIIGALTTAAAYLKQSPLPKVDDPTVPKEDK